MRPSVLLIEDDARATRLGRRGGLDFLRRAGAFPREDTLPDLVILTVGEEAHDVGAALFISEPVGPGALGSAVNAVGHSRPNPSRTPSSPCPRV